MSLEGVGSNTGVQAGEGSARDEGNGGDGERGAAPRETMEAVTWTWKGLAMLMLSLTAGTLTSWAHLAHG